MHYTYLILFIVLLLLTAGCKKYEEGPAISLRSAESRVIGSKEIVSYIVDGVDSTGYIFTDILPTCENKITFGNIDKKHGPHAPNGPIQIPCSDATNGFGGVSSWNFANDDKTKMWFGLGYALDIPPDSFTILTFINRDIIWDIKKLTNEELWLGRENGKYELKLKER